MKEVYDYPPNFDLISAVLSPKRTDIYCYGDIIYNPSRKSLTPDEIFHEHIHSIQQGEDVDGWYNSYLTDADFRLEQELIAYGEQYAFACKFITSEKLRRWARENMSRAISGVEYGNLISFQVAESKIRNYAKNPRYQAEPVFTTDRRPLNNRVAAQNPL